MAKSSGQKLKLLYLRDILLKKTDETHKLTAAEIIDALNGYGISSERKSLYDDLSLLANYGLDICREKPLPQNTVLPHGILSLLS